MTTLATEYRSLNEVESMLWGMAVATDWRAVAGAFERALAAVQMKHETAAHLMGCSKVQLHQQLHGTGHLSMFRVFEMRRDEDGRKFLEAFFRELSLVGGLRDWDGIVAGLLKFTNAITDGISRASSTRNSDERRIA